jgi:hypothetical protein
MDPLSLRTAFFVRYKAGDTQTTFETTPVETLEEARTLARERAKAGHRGVQIGQKVTVEAIIESHLYDDPAGVLWDEIEPTPTPFPPGDGSVYSGHLDSTPHPTA